MEEKFTNSNNKISFIVSLKLANDGAFNERNRYICFRYW